MPPGYSDRINHALAFAAKHHDQQVRRGTRLPYWTQPANVAVILTRYGQDEDTVVAGILHDVVEDYVRDGYTPEMLDARITDKFGRDVLGLALAASRRRQDEEGVDLSSEEQREDFLARLAHADERARWICASDTLHNVSTILSDLHRTEYPEAVWGRFAAGREATIRSYRQLYDRLCAVGFRAPIMDELRSAVESLAAYSEPETRRTDRRPGARG